MEKKEYEREINLKSLVCYILKKWKLMLVMALILMIVFGIYEFISIFKTNKVNGNLENEKTYIQIVQDALDGLGNPKDLKGALLLYYNILLQQKNIEVSIKNDEIKLEGSKSNLEARKQQLDEFEQVPQESLNGEDISTFIYYKNIADASVVHFENEIKDYEYDIQKLRSDLEQNKKNAEIILNKLLQQQKNKENNTKATSYKTYIKSIVKYASVGFLGGVILFVFLQCIKYMLSGKLTDVYVLRDAYGLRIVSVIPTEVKSSIDRQIEKLNECVSATKEQAYDIIYARIINLIGEAKNKNILFTGTVAEKETKCIIDYLKNKDNTINYVFCPNVIENPDSILMYNDADEILLVEGKESSKLKDIEQELSYMQDINKTPLGVIVINSIK